jgi:AAA15 family ATPase/GTPase
MFNSNLNEMGAQLIFTTHDTNLLDPDLLRRDQIYFAEKNSRFETCFYSLYDFKGIRNDASYEKDYIKGKYGAIPYLGDIEKVLD